VQHRHSAVVVAETQPRVPNAEEHCPDVAVVLRPYESRDSLTSRDEWVRAAWVQQHR
jgi:hypothetical protein